MKQLLLLILRLYKLLVSPFFLLVFGGGCRHVPTCSEYTYDAISSQGSIRGSFLGIKRIVSCNPYSKITSSKSLRQ